MAKWKIHSELSADSKAIPTQITRMRSTELYKRMQLNGASDVTSDLHNPFVIFFVRAFRSFLEKEVSELWKGERSEKLLPRFYPGNGYDIVVSETMDKRNVENFVDSIVFYCYCLWIGLLLISTREVVLRKALQRETDWFGLPANIWLICGYCICCFIKYCLRNPFVQKYFSFDAFETFKTNLKKACFSTRYFACIFDWLEKSLIF